MPIDNSVRAAAMLGPDGPFASSVAGYELRPSQLRMAEAVQDALAHDGILLAEAGTGTGKTLAYLVPALLSGRKVVVSTGTRTLQDQIMRHDVPLLQRVLGHDAVSVSCMKGLNNYLCRRRFELLQGSARSFDKGVAERLPMLIDWAATSGEGDRAELGDLPADSPLWSEVQSAPETRVGAKCAHYDECFVTGMRRRAADASVIVVNHHLFFADLALKGQHGGGAIPAYDAVIFDEAHLIEDIATEFFGTSVSKAQLEVLLRDAERALSISGAMLTSRRYLDDVTGAGAALFAALPRSTQADNGREPLPPNAFSGDVEQALFGLDAALDALGGLCERTALDAEERGTSELLSPIARRSHGMRDDLAAIADGGRGDDVTWTAQRGRGVSIGCSPIDIGDILRERLYARAQGTIFTSATLSTGGNFSFVKARLGMDFEVDELLLASPFDYDHQAALYMPDGLPDPRDSGFIDAAIEEVVRLVTLTGGGAFVLCTSLRAMRALTKGCRPRLRGEILMQGEAPNGMLLSRFREARDAVLFATASFWQGVDVPGEALRLVVIDKLPFDVPTDPLIEARCRRLEAAGTQPFIKYLVPAAALTLKQGFGRLIRARSDRGIVAILDRRLTKKGYGQLFLRSLPPARRCATFEALDQFWSESEGDEPAEPAVGGWVVGEPGGVQ